MIASVIAAERREAIDVGKKYISIARYEDLLSKAHAYTNIL
jgi:hypothetical protein